MAATASSLRVSRPALLLVREAAHERVREQRRVARAVAQRRHRHDDLRQAVEQVLAELALQRSGRCRFWCVALTMRTSTGISSRPPTPLDRALLQEAQQLGLQRHRQVADLVEEQRAAGWRSRCGPASACIAPVNAPFS